MQVTNSSNQSVRAVLFLIVALKSKDILMAVMFTVNMVYRCATKKNDMLVTETSDEIERIIAFIPTYMESLEQVSRTIDSLLTSNVGTHYMLTFVVSDGVNNYDALLDNVSFTRNSFYIGWKGAKVNVSMVYGTRNGKPIVVLHKDKNQGKKDSILLCNDIFNYARNNGNIENNQMINTVREDIKVIFQVADFDYIFSTDADTVVSNDTVACLVDTIKTRQAVACCGVVNVDKTKESSCHATFWNNLQNVQYLYGQYMRRSNEDIFDQVLCLPGCVTMYKVDPSMGTALTLYSEDVGMANVVLSCVQYVGTDRRFTNSIVYTNNNAKIVFDQRTHVYTSPPNSLNAYVHQRRRWCQNMYFNNMMNIVGPNVNFVLRFFNLIDFIRLSIVYFRLFNTLYFVYLLASNRHYVFIELVPYIVILSYPILAFMVYALFNAHLRSQYFTLLVYLIINRMFTMFSTVVIFTSMLGNIGNGSWN